MFAKSCINRNKFNNKSKVNIKNSHVISFIQKDINGHVKHEQDMEIFKVNKFKAFQR